MDLVVRQLNKIEFEDTNVPILFEDSPTDRRFAIATFNNYSYRFAWQSDLMNPNILKIKEKVYAIGIDQNFSIIDFEINSIVYNVKLFYNFLDMRLHNELLYVITELEIIVITVINFKTNENFDLPDNFDSISFFKDCITVKCMDGTFLEIPGA
jgi:hypothetical protein